MRQAVKLCLLPLAFASGCALLPTAPPPVPPLLAPAALGQPLAASQTISVAYRDNDFSLQGALAVDADAVTLIAFGPLGGRALNLHYDGTTLKAETGPAVPAGFPPAQLLSDVELVLWPSAAWQAALAGSDWKLLEPVPGLRRLRYRGRLVAEVHYADGGDGARSRAWISNLAYGYTLELRTSAQ